jgi:hypothetical protein
MANAYSATLRIHNVRKATKAEIQDIATNATGPV